MLQVLGEDLFRRGVCWDVGPSVGHLAYQVQATSNNGISLAGCIFIFKALEVIGALIKPHWEAARPTGSSAEHHLIAAIRTPAP